MLADVNDDGLLDIVYGNWLGPHRMLIQVTLTLTLKLSVGLSAGVGLGLGLGCI